MSVCLRTSVNEWGTRVSERTREVSVDALRLNIFMSYQSIFVGIILFSFLMSKQREKHDRNVELAANTTTVTTKRCDVCECVCVILYSNAFVRILRYYMCVSLFAKCTFLLLVDTNAHAHAQTHKTTKLMIPIELEKEVWVLCVCANQCCGHQKNGGSIVIAMNVVVVVVMVVVRFRYRYNKLNLHMDLEIFIAHSTYATTLLLLDSTQW